MESKISLVITRINSVPIKKTIKINAPITFTAQKNIESDSDSCTTWKKEFKKCGTGKNYQPYYSRTRRPLLTKQVFPLCRSNMHQPGEISQSQTDDCRDATLVQHRAEIKTRSELWVTPLTLRGTIKVKQKRANIHGLLWSKKNVREAKSVKGNSMVKIAKKHSYTCKIQQHVHKF